MGDRLLPSRRDGHRYRQSVLTSTAIEKAVDALSPASIIALALKVATMRIESPERRQSGLDVDLDRYRVLPAVQAHPAADTLVVGGVARLFDLGADPAAVKALGATEAGPAHGVLRW
jgi:hypothetical protein